MSGTQVPAVDPVDSVGAAIDAMQQIESALPPDDGVACFNRMYLGVTQAVDARIKQGQFANPELMGRLDVVFANLYLDAVRAAATDATVPNAWAPLFDRRTRSDIEPIQFALAGMNAHINHDLPIAVVTTCTEHQVEPEQGSTHADYQQVDALLDAAEQSVRQSFESKLELDADRHVQAVADVVCNFSINSARDLAWDNALVLWHLREHPTASTLFLSTLARGVEVSSRTSLVAPPLA
jgi:hypothetical protein